MWNVLGWTRLFQFIFGDQQRTGIAVTFGLIKKHKKSPRLRLELCCFFHIQIIFRKQSHSPSVLKFSQFHIFVFKYMCECECDCRTLVSSTSGILFEFDCFSCRVFRFCCCFWIGAMRTLRYVNEFKREYQLDMNILGNLISSNGTKYEQRESSSNAYTRAGLLNKIWGGRLAPNFFRGPFFSPQLQVE